MNKGIALTELVIVAAIVGVFAVVLVPVFATAQGDTGAQKCQSHGMKLGAAMLAYMSDYDGRFPSAATEEMLAPFSHITWRYRWPAYPPSHSDVCGVSLMNQYEYIQLARYVKDKDTWICPAPTTMHALKYAYRYRCSWLWRTTNLGQSNYPDTAFQYSNSYDPEDPKNGVGLTLTEVLAKDRADWGRCLTPSKKFFGWCYSLGEDIRVGAYPGGPLITPSYAHGEGSIYLFADGHAKWCEMGCGFAPVRYTDAYIDRPHSQP